MTSKNYNRVLPTFLPDGREVDVRYFHDPAERPSEANPCGTPADATLWAVIDLADRDITLELAPEVRAALEAECRADAECCLR